MRKRRISHRVLDHTYPELSVARATLVLTTSKQPVKTKTTFE